MASVTEGVELRKNGITGTILILGYTHPDSFPLLWKYRLTQTVVDYPYAQSLNACRKKVQVHLKIDTGMHRLGIRSDHIEEISRMFQMDNLLVDGIYTHLCCVRQYGRLATENLPISKPTPSILYWKN